MACYICLGEGVQTSATGLCGKCSQNACGRPPQRPDGQFHGDVCAATSCGLFFCEPHLHAHAHAASGVSAAFPALSLAIGVDVLSAAAAFAEGVPSGNTNDITRNLLASFNRYLNVVSPGGAALYEQHDRLPAQTFRVRHVDRDTSLVLFDGEFFTPDVATTVTRMAVRTMQIAEATLRPSRQQTTIQRMLAPWLDVLGRVPTYAVVELDAQQTDWLLQTLHRLPRPLSMSMALDLDALPSESNTEALTSFLLAKRAEGEEGALTA